jgi:hypothetical protein
LEIPPLERKEKGAAEDKLEREVSKGGRHAGRPNRAQRP